MSVTSDLFSPFRRPAPKGLGIPYVEVCSAEERIDLVKTMSVADLEKILALGTYLQSTVRKAAESRLRRLRRAAQAPNATPNATASATRENGR